MKRKYIAAYIILSTLAIGKIAAMENNYEQNRIFVSTDNIKLLKAKQIESVYRLARDIKLYIPQCQIKYCTKSDATAKTAESIMINDKMYFLVKNIDNTKYYYLSLLNNKESLFNSINVRIQYLEMRLLTSL